VLQGEVEMQVRGGPIRRLKVGDTFYELPDDIHQVSRNVSTSAPAKFLVHMIKKAGEPATVPVP
jgi:quercetin dioxygenase-like cupin family protein